MDWMSYATLAESRAHDDVDAADTEDDPRRVEKLRAATADIFRYCGERIFQPVQKARPFDWESNEYLGFRGYDLLTLTSLTDGTGNLKQAAALIMLGSEFSDSTKYGPWYAVECDTTKDFFLYNVTAKRCMTVTGQWGFYDDYGIAGANAWAPVFTDSTLVTALAPSGSVTSALRIIPLNAAPANAYDALYQNLSISAGALIQMDSEWMQVLAVANNPAQIVVQRGANGTSPATHTTASTITVFKSMSDIKEATLRLTSFLLRQDDAPFGKTLMPAQGTVIIPYKMPPDVCDKLDRYIKRRVA